MKILFAGSNDFSNAILQALLQQGENIIHVLTQTDKPAGRGKHMHATPVKETALAHHIPVSTPITLRDAAVQAELQALQADVLLVVAYGLLLPQAILSLTPYPINVHPSLLPRWRGASPVESPLLAGDTMSGVTIMEMVTALDAGPILKQQAITLAADETRDSLYQRLTPLSIELLTATLKDIREHSVQKTAQDDALACYAHKWTKEDLHLNWLQTAVQLDRHIRAFATTPGAYTVLDNTPIKILRAHIDDTLTNEPKNAGHICQVTRQGLWVQTAAYHVCITEIQIAGKKPMAIQDALNGYSHWFSVGRTFT
jgi:methionyl-tRNA formyltransferase